jgi:hypothetical protein
MKKGFHLQAVTITYMEYKNVIKLPWTAARYRIQRAVAHIPGANIKEFLVTILSEAKRPQIQLFEPKGRVLGLQ